MLETILQFISPIITAFFAWLLTSRKYKKDIEKLDLENSSIKHDYLGKINAEMEEKLQKLGDESNKLFNQVVELLSENRDLKLQIEDLRKTNDILQQKIQKLSDKLDSLK